MPATPEALSSAPACTCLLVGTGTGVDALAPWPRWSICAPSTTRLSAGWDATDKRASTLRPVRRSCCNPMTAVKVTSGSGTPGTGAPLSSVSWSSCNVLPALRKSPSATSSVIERAPMLVPARAVSNVSGTSCCLTWLLGPLTRKYHGHRDRGPAWSCMADWHTRPGAGGVLG